MATLDHVVFIRQGPVDELGKETRDGHGHGAPGAKHAHQFGHRGRVFGDVLEHFGANHVVKVVVGEGQMQGVALNHGHLGVSRQLPRFDHEREGAEHAFHFVATRVQGDHLGTATSGFVGVAAKAAAHVQNLLAGLEA